MSKPTSTELDSAIEYVQSKNDNDDDWGYSWLGVRTQDVPFNLGALDWESQTMHDDEPTGEMLGGVSATDVETSQRYTHAEGRLNFESYFGNYVAILGSDYASYGDDVGEIIMVDPEVLYIFP